VRKRLILNSNFEKFSEKIDLISKIFFPQILRLIYVLSIKSKKQIEKILTTFRDMLKNVDPPSWIDPPFLANMYDKKGNRVMLLVKKTNSLQKTECKNVSKSQSCASLISGRHL
jgi:hypothetical protein